MNLMIILWGARDCAIDLKRKWSSASSSLQRPINKWPSKQSLFFFFLKAFLFGCFVNRLLCRSVV